eukprot:gene26148-29537_t
MIALGQLTESKPSRSTSYAASSPVVLCVRARCNDCGYDFSVAFSCKGRGVSPSCSTRRMAETAAHLTYHVFPRLLS